MEAKLLVQNQFLRELDLRRIESELSYTTYQMKRVQKKILEPNCFYFISEGFALVEELVDGRRTSTIMHNAMSILTPGCSGKTQMIFHDDCVLYEITKTNFEHYVHNNRKVDDLVLMMLEAQEATIAQLKEHIGILESTNGNERVNGMIRMMAKYSNLRISDLLIAELSGIRRETSQRLRNDR